MDKISQLEGGTPVGYFTSMAEDLNSWLPRTNQASREGGTWTEGLQITSPAVSNLAMLPPLTFIWTFSHSYDLQKGVKLLSV